MERFAPLVFDEEVSFQRALQHEIVPIIPLLQQVFLQYGQLGLVQSDQATLRVSHRPLLSYLQVLIKENLLPKRPPNINSTDISLLTRVLLLIPNTRVLRLPRILRRHHQRQLPKQHYVHERVLHPELIECLPWTQVNH